jgi:NAD(P)-dependent dehydrogenase (short-subunit alcohol dehydrogenase family)
MSVDTLSLAGKVAIITGSGRENGIGAGIVLALARNGAAVTINCISNSSAPRAEAVAEKIRSIGGIATVIRAAVDQEGAKALVQGTLKAFGVDHIDILGTLSGHLEHLFIKMALTFDTKSTMRDVAITLAPLVILRRILKNSSALMFSAQFMSLKKSYQLCLLEAESSTSLPLLQRWACQCCLSTEPRSCPGLFDICLGF